MNAHDRPTLLKALNGLDRWFDGMRVEWPTPGYGGPVAHWWGHSLAYCGTGLDWRYEGTVDGYLRLWRVSGQPHWLEQATRAGLDLLDGQLENGHFRNSCFERNPGEGGTPHEAAADIALLLLARELRLRDPLTSEHCLGAAHRNLERYWLGQLWDECSATLWDSPGVPSFVPNKAATFLEAVLLLAELTGASELIERYALPTGDRILALQAHVPGQLSDGAIAQSSLGGVVVAAYFPLYIARCVPPLLGLHAVTGDERYRCGARAALRFLERVREPDGGFPQVLYGNGRRNRRPRWIAGSGDILRAFLTDETAEHDPAPTLDWLLRGVRTDGHIATAEGFGGIVPFVTRRDGRADELGVVGWCDKAFRALSMLVQPADMRAAEEEPFRVVELVRTL